MRGSSRSGLFCFCLFLSGWTVDARFLEDLRLDEQVDNLSVEETVLDLETQNVESTLGRYRLLVWAIVRG